MLRYLNCLSVVLKSYLFPGAQKERVLGNFVHMPERTFFFFLIIWDYLPKRMSVCSRSPSQNRNNQQSHIINILLASFARSVRRVMDPRFFLPCFHGPRASRLGHERKEKTRSITCRTDRANEANKMFIIKAV